MTRWFNCVYVCPSVLIYKIFRMVNFKLFKKPSLSRISYYHFQQPLIIIIVVPGRMFAFIMVRIASRILSVTVVKSTFLSLVVSPPKISDFFFENTRSHLSRKVVPVYNCLTCNFDFLSDITLSLWIQKSR